MTNGTAFDLFYFKISFTLAQRVGGLGTALLLWESCALSSLLYNCSTWLGMGRKEEEALAECHFFFLRLALGTGPGAPKHALRVDLGVRSTLLRVWQQKIMLVHHIRSLEDESLTKMMYKEQVKTIGQDWLTRLRGCVQSST